MVSAVSISGIGGSIDLEHQRIIQQLTQMGISPSYNKSLDKSKLEKAKAELIEKIQSKQETKAYLEDSGENYGVTDDNYYTARAEMEEQRLGAMTLAELNKFYLGLA